MIEAGGDKIRMAILLTGPGQECRLLGVVNGGRACRKNGMGWGGMGDHEWMMDKQHAQLESEQKSI